MSRNINTSSKIHLHAPDYLYKTDNLHTKVDAHPVLCVLSFNLDIWLFLFLKIFVLEEETMCFTLTKITSVIMDYWNSLIIQFLTTLVA